MATIISAVTVCVLPSLQWSCFQFCLSVSFQEYLDLTDWNEIQRKVYIEAMETWNSCLGPHIICLSTKFHLLIQCPVAMPF